MGGGMTIDPESGLYMGEQVFLPFKPTSESDGLIRIQMTHDIHCLVRSKLHGMIANANCRPKNMLRMALNLNYYPKMRQPSIKDHLGMTGYVFFRGTRLTTQRSLH